MNWSLWLTVSLVFMIIEIITPGLFFFACLAIGAFFAGLSTFLFAPFWLPWMVFCIVSIVSIYSIRPIAKKLFKPSDSKSNVDALIGKKAVVTDKIEPPNLGMVKIDGELWRAESKEVFSESEIVEVVAVSGTRLEVKKSEADK